MGTDCIVPTNNFRYFIHIFNFAFGKIYYKIFNIFVNIAILNKSFQKKVYKCKKTSQKRA